jgi:hypothetical protein
MWPEPAPISSTFSCGRGFTSCSSAGLDLGRQHDLPQADGVVEVAAQRDLHVDERERLVLRRHEVLAVDGAQQLQDVRSSTSQGRICCSIMLKRKRSRVGVGFMAWLSLWAQDKPSILGGPDDASGPLGHTKVFFMPCLRGAR